MIKGNLVTIRHLKEGDRNIYHKWINDRALVNFNKIYRPISEVNHNDWFDKVTKIYNLAIFSIVENSDNSLIGSCSLRNIDYLHKNARVQIRIGESDKRGNGFGSEAVFLLLCHAFEDLNLERVYLNVFVDNKRAIKAYNKIGFIEEGLLRRAVFINGSYVDSILMSVIKSEFDTIKEKFK